MATLLKVLNNLADIKSAGGVALRVRTQDLFAHNGVLNNRMKAAGRGWLQFIEALLTDPDAELNFDPPKQSMAAE